MQIGRFGSRLVVRLESGEEVMESLVRLARKEGFGFAALTGLGAARSATIAFYDVATRQYEKHDLEEQMEVNSLVGNISQRDGRPFAHVHATLGRRDMSTVGGHLFAAVAHATVELSLTVEPERIERLPDEPSGLSLLELPERG